MRRRALPYNVVEGARLRIRNIFSNGLPIFLNISGGKDSICLAHLIYEMVQRGEVDASLLHVQFIDEEAIFNDVERIVLDWRKKFMLAGVKFDWYCIPVKHFNCFNQLTSDETFICWDPAAKDTWIRKPPAFAVRSHPMLRPGYSYQEFLHRINTGGITLAGVRVAESVQRLMTFRPDFKNPSNERLFMPIYDWKDTDVWRYIQEHGLDFPETYLHLYQVGNGRRGMRISQFFSIDTAKCLVKMAEFEPDLMDRITRREPNAYLAALYWDSEMFRSSGGAADADKKSTPQDWRALVLARLRSEEQRSTAEGRRLGALVRSIAVRRSTEMNQKHWKGLYDALIGGDPKNRAVRAVINDIASTGAKESQNE